MLIVRIACLWRYVRVVIVQSLIIGQLMKDTILCAIDFSESSVQSFQYAVRLASTTNAKLTILFSYRLIQTGQTEGVLGFKKKMENEAREKYQELEKKVINGKDLSHVFLTEIGFMADNLESYIRRNSIAMLVISHSIYLSLNDHKGPTFETFLNTVNVPLLVVPD
jgi:nucleotide-binding universal stress UspA family protein